MRSLRKLTERASIGSRTAIAIYMIVALWILIALPVAADSGTAELFRGREGPYALIVGILPEEPLVGTVHFSIVVRDAETREPIANADVLLVVSDDSGEPRFQSPALLDPRIPGEYEANIIFDAAGTWDIRIDIDTPELGEATFMTQMVLGGPALPAGSQGIWVLLGIVVILAGGVTYLSYQARRNRLAGRTSH